MKKNICFLNGDMSRSGGTERVTAMIASELSKYSEYKIHILSITNESNKSFFAVSSDVTLNRILKKSDVDFKRNYLKVVQGIRRYIKQHKINLIIDVDVIASLFSIPATRFIKTKVISWEHFHYGENNGSSLRGIARKLAARYSDQIITLTQADKECYEHNLRIKGEIDYIYNPIVQNHDLTCDINSKQIISVGRLTYQKGFDMLCDVAKSVLPCHPDWRWIIVGEGEDRGILESKIKEYHLENQLILLGEVLNVECYYLNSSLYVMTSRFEGLPMTLLEAQSYDLPIVSFDCKTGPSEIVKDNVNGYLIQPNDCESMSQKLDLLLTETGAIEILNKNVRKNINYFKMSEVVKKWEEKINNL